MSFREQIDPALVADPVQTDRIRRATAVLRDVIGETADDVTAVWERDLDTRGSPLVMLTLDNPPGRIRRRFYPRELDDSADTRWNLRRLWGDLAVERARAFLSEARALATAGEEVP